MKSFATLSLFAVLAASISASPVQKRADQIECEDTSFSQTLSVSYAGNTYYYRVGDDSTLVDTNSDGSVVTKDDAQKFDFKRCKSSYLKTTGYTTSEVVGILKPAGDSENCLQTKETATSGSQEFVVAPCSLDDDASQEKQTWNYGSRHNELRFHQSIGDGYFTNAGNALELVAGKQATPYQDGSDFLTYAA